MSQREERATDYAFAKASPVKQWAEEPTLMRLAGDLRGRSVLDLACGSGHYARLWKRAGAVRVLGVDVSADMIAAARAEEARQPLGIEYQVGNAADVGGIGGFDLVTAVYLFVYAQTIDALGSMCATVAANLAPQGRLLAATLNPELDLAAQIDFARAGLHVERLDASRDDGAAVRVRIGSEAGVYEVLDHLWSRSAYETCLRAAGLAVTWHPLTLAAEGRARLGEPFWNEILANPPIAVFTAERRSFTPANRDALS